ncbi:MAG: 6-bladed beta-propeller, partial [Gemmatimonadetes bacterium]|nr:6-bladed beta-propeller [Gemmatimonadota bacterium]MYE70053.1 6-bladed beta-propeller [Gemmatimonadota bacterium]MYJ68152.1 6-bladed beta-propeller [Gemmatimonadota bacterium]
MCEAGCAPDRWSSGDCSSPTMNRRRTRLPLRLAAWLATPILAGCSDTPERGPEFTPVQDWVTEPDYEFGDTMEGDAVFGSVTDVNVHSSADGLRVYVLDGRSSEVTIWTPDGTLIRRVGRDGPGPGEFQRPVDLVVLQDRFHVSDERRFTTFALDGEFLRTNMVPLSMSWRGFRLRHQALFADGSVVATPIVPTRIMAGSMGDDPVDVLPAVRVFREGSAWALDTLALISYRNWVVPFRVPGETLPANLTQEWVVPDSFRPDPVSGHVILARIEAVPPGTIELIEISLGGDTVWTRQVRLPPMPIGEDEAEAIVLQRAAAFASWGGDSIPSPSLRRRVRDAIVVPEAWPVTRGIRVMPNGEIWFRAAKSDVPGVWYAVPRADGDGPVRRITLPESFNPRDVLPGAQNCTHVGIQNGTV